MRYASGLYRDGSSVEVIKSGLIHDLVLHNLLFWSCQLFFVLLHTSCELIISELSICWAYHLWKVKVKVAQSCLTLCNPKDCSPWNSPGQNTGVGSLSLLQGIFPTQGLISGLLHCDSLPAEPEGCNQISRVDLI